MSIIKKAIAPITSQDIRHAALDTDDPVILQYFKKTAADLKAIAPKANDFLYFTCIMMHAAEAALLDDFGKRKKLANGQDYDAHWDVDNSGSWKWIANSDEVKPYKNFNCLVPGTDILMGDGSHKAIEDIVVGDEVITHKGRIKKVKEIFKHDNDAEIYHLKIKNHPPITITSEHPMYAIAGDFVRKSKLNKIIQNNPDPEWVMTKNLEVGDFILSPILKTDKQSDLTPNQARLLGLFAAEGSYSKKYNKKQNATFTFNISELNLANLVKTIIEEEFPECSVKIKQYQCRQITTVTVTGYNIAEWFFYHVGEYSHTKKLSKDLFYGSDEVKRQFLLGWLEGDGCLTVGNKLVGISTSPHLAWQTTMMARSLGINTSIRKKNNQDRLIQIDLKYPEYKTRDNYRIEVYGANADKICANDSVKYNLSVSELAHKNISQKVGNYFIHRITDITKKHYTGPVYNFEVEDDHSYVANGLIVHNSDIFPRQELKKAYKKWVGKPLCLDHQSQSVDMIRGVIVDTVYDDKMDRIVALCALDKKNYPDLAHKVASGVSASVSMGVAVGKAICTEKGCHRVARTENEFCSHMRAKNGYGEINVELSPIELSIVVNGADPKAKIRRIVAAADQAANYVEKQQLDEAGITAEDAQVLKDLCENNISQVESVNNESFNSEVIEPPYGHGGVNAENAPQVDAAVGNVPQAANTDRFASEVIERLKEKIAQLEAIINNKASIKMAENTNNEDTVMGNEKKAYFLGGGGVNEPTPKQTKYPKEEADNIRNSQDKQMTGQSDTGPVDGLHPGYESFGESELERKKRLLRASDEAQARALRREAAMDKAKETIKQKREAYFNGGGGANEPTPGKVKYPNETDYTKIRDKEDKQMTGEKPFPDVGSVEGLYGDDEKKKKLINRASLSAVFVKAATADGSDDLANSCWNIYAKDDSGKRLILSAKVKELAGESRVKAMYSAIATKDYGTNMIKTIREAGLKTAQELFNPGEIAGVAKPSDEKVKEIMTKYVCKKLPNDAVFRACSADEAAMFADNNMQAPFGYEFKLVGTAKVKSAQAVPGAQPGATPAVGAPAAMPAMPAMPAVEAPDPGAPEGDADYAGETGSPVDAIKKSVDDLGNIQADLEKGLEALEGEEGVEEEAAAAPGVVTASVMRTKLHSALIKGFKQSLAEVSDIKEELELIGHIVGSGADVGNKELVQELYTEAKADVKKVKANVKTIMESFVRYANGNALLAKTAQAELGETMENGMSFDELLDSLNTAPEGDDDLDLDCSLADDKKSKKEKKEEKEEKKEEKEEKKEEKEEKEEEEEEEEEEDKNDAVMTGDKVEFTPDEAKDIWGKSASTMTRKERDLLRVKLAQKGIQFSEMLGKAHPKGGTTTALDVKPTGDGAKVEDLEEVHDKVMDVALKAPKAVKAAAEKLQKFIVEGTVDPAKDFPSLIAEGLDPAAVAYWKKMWGEAKDQEASQFVNELVKDYKNKQASDEKETMRVKYARAWELAHKMAERGLVSRDSKSMSQQVEEILSYNDQQFKHFASTISKLPVKQASIGDVIAQNGAGDSVVKAAKSYAVPEEEDLTSLFDQAFAKRKY